MAVTVIDKIKPKNNGTFPVADAVDIAVTDELRLNDALEGKADTTVTDDLQNQINAITTGVPEEAEVLQARTSSSGTVYDTLKQRLDTENTALASDISAVSSEIDSAIEITKLSTLPLHRGHQSDSGTWNNVSTSYQHVVIPVKSGDKIAIKAGSNTLWYGVLKSYTEPVGGASIDYSTASGFTSKRSVAASGKTDFTCPSDAHYIILEVIYNTENAYPAVFTVNSFDYVLSLTGNVKSCITAQAGIESTVREELFVTGFKHPIKWESGTFTQNIGSISTDVESVSRQRMDKIDKSNIPLYLISDGVFLTRVVYYTNANVVESYTDYTADRIIIPANKKFRMVIEDASDPSRNISSLSSDEINSHISIMNDIDLLVDTEGIEEEIDMLDSKIENAIGVENLSYMTLHQGHQANNSTWNNINSSYQHLAIPIQPNDVIRITTGSQALWYGVLSSYTTPVDGVAIPYSADSAYSAKKGVAENTTVEFTCPFDAAYIIIEVIYGGVSSYPDSFTINGFDYTKTLTSNVINSIETQAQIEPTIRRELFTDGFDHHVEWESGTFGQTIGETSANIPIAIRQRMVSVEKSDIPLFLISDGTFSTRIVFFEENDNDELVVEGWIDYTTERVEIPAKKWFRMVIKDAEDGDRSIAGVTSDEINSHQSIKNDSIMQAVSSVKTVNWCAMGDSITEGYVSYIDPQTGEPTSKILKASAWATKVAQKNNWNLSNIGIGGTGWLKATVQQEAQGINTTGAWYVARHTDFTPYDLVTLAFGVNDWKANKSMGSIDDSIEVDTPTTVIQAMKITIESIMSSNPHCKICVILPINCAGYSFSYGDKSTNYGLGYSFSNSGTLESFTQKLIEVCNYYSIEYIDMTHYSCVNRCNLLDSLTDGVHPNAETHQLMANELCEKIMYR